MVKVGGGQGIDLEHVAESFATLVASGAAPVYASTADARDERPLRATRHIPARGRSPARPGTSAGTSTARTLDVFEMDLLAGQVNKDVRRVAAALRVDAVEYASGIDGGVWLGAQGRDPFGREQADRDRAR
ncbi:MAG: hypothetical protein R3B49_01830 [Phycisphaerales bacterium]